MKKHLTLAVAVMAVALAVSSVALAQGMGGKGGQGFGGGMGVGPGAGMGIERLLDNPQIIAELGLTDSQVKQLKDIQSKSQRDAIKVKAEVDVLQLDLKDLLDQDNPDMKKVDSLLDQIGAKHTEMQKSMIHSLIDMKGALTDEQKAKVKELIAEKMKERGQNRDGRRGKGGGQGMGPGGGMGQGPMTAPPEDEE